MRCLSRSAHSSLLNISCSNLLCFCAQNFFAQHAHLCSVIPRSAGVFGNDRAWIQAAIQAAHERFLAWPIDARLILFQLGQDYVGPPAEKKKSSSDAIFGEWK